MAAELMVRHVAGDAFTVTVRDHEVTVDQPVADGGTDTGPTPTELFVAGLAACVGFYAERFLRRHGIPPDGLAVRCSFTMAEDRPARVTDVELVLDLPPAFPADRREALYRVVEHCTVHNTLRQPPTVRLRLDSSRGGGLGAA